MLKPAAIPVILGWGTTIDLRAMFLLFGEARFFRLGDAFFPARARRHAFLLMPPAFLIAHLGSFDRATATTYLSSYLIFSL